MGTHHQQQQQYNYKMISRYWAISRRNLLFLNSTFSCLGISLNDAFVKMENNVFILFRIQTISRALCLTTPQQSHELALSQVALILYAHANETVELLGPTSNQDNFDQADFPIYKENFPLSYSLCCNSSWWPHRGAYNA